MIINTGINKNVFVNQIPTSMEMGIPQMFTIIKDLIKGNPRRMPAVPIPVERLNVDVLTCSQQAKAIWFGHSTVLLEIEGKKLLLDPTFANSPSPFPFFGGKRFSKALPIRPEELMSIDIVILSHDHYDHLDYHSIMQLKDKTSLFCVPVGIGSRLKNWQIVPEKIREFSWWEKADVDGLTLACTPARHFSGRGLLDRNATLWCSWTMMGQKTSIYFSGDGGYGPHFAEIGEKYGPFDLTLLECGQYDERWSAIHMVPEETVQAHLDLKGNLMIPIHWAAFSLAFHDWTEPIERVTKAAKERNVAISTPRIGEPVTLGSVAYPKSIWWK
jgi:L-ascorbate metabolism protein UlaG (beta-lactamase superfamily)